MWNKVTVKHSTQNFSSFLLHFNPSIIQTVYNYINNLTRNIFQFQTREQINNRFPQIQAYKKQTFWVHSGWEERVGIFWNTKTWRKLRQETRMAQEGFSSTYEKITKTTWKYSILIKNNFDTLSELDVTHGVTQGNYCLKNKIKNVPCI